MSAHQKVGTFRLVNGRKQGGNVASYFCTPDGAVVHAVAGPAGAAEFLREARWAVDTHNLAAASVAGDPLAYRRVLQRAHLARLADEHHATLPARLVVTPPDESAKPGDGAFRLDALRGRPAAAQVAGLLAAYPAARLADVFPVVWTDILNERVSPLPVRVR